MSVLIKGVEMPKNCTECSCLNDEYWSCQASAMELFGEGADKKRPNWCPLVPVPPHGRLIDADAVIKGIETDAIWKYNAINEYDSGIRSGARAVMRSVRNAPTIIPAEVGE